MKGILTLNAVINPVIPRTTMAHAIVTLTILLVAGFVNGSPSSSFPPLVPPELLPVDVFVLYDEDDDDEVDVGAIPFPMREVMVVLTKRSV